MGKRKSKFGHGLAIVPPRQEVKVLTIKKQNLAKVFDLAIWWYREKNTNLIDPNQQRAALVGLDQICFFFYPFCFSLMLKFSPSFAFYCTHFAFNYTHFASHD